MCILKIWNRCVDLPSLPFFSVLCYAVVCCAVLCENIMVRLLTREKREVRRGEGPRDI